MADHTELLKSMLQDIINDRHDNAQVTMHDYFVSKTREVTGMGVPEQEPPEAAHAATDLGDDETDDE